MNEETIPVTVHILDREYRITCPAGEEDSLKATAYHLNQRMQEVKNSGKVVGIDRIAVMVALNITHELLENRPTDTLLYDNISSRIKALQDKIDIALSVD